MKQGTGEVHMQLRTRFANKIFINCIEVITDVRDNKKQFN